VLFLDEVGEMSPAVQAKFLRVLQEREYQRLGGALTRKADVRVLAAPTATCAGDRAGLLPRGPLLSARRLRHRAAALRERSETCCPSWRASSRSSGRSVGRPRPRLQEVRDKLVSYSWPGNVRELRNAVERAVILCEGGLITSDHLPLGVASGARRDAGPSPAPAAAQPRARCEATEREMIARRSRRPGTTSRSRRSLA
jgi:DNA-binding NtrC family response regulator